MLGVGLHLAFFVKDVLAKGGVVLAYLKLLRHITAILLGIIAVLAFRALQLDQTANILVFCHVRHTPKQPAQIFCRSVSIEEAVGVATKFDELHHKLMSVKDLRCAQFLKLVANEQVLTM
jgi:hypothetical protein